MSVVHQGNISIRKNENIYSNKIIIIFFIILASLNASVDGSISDVLLIAFKNFVTTLAVKVRFFSGHMFHLYQHNE
jgi:hypothetical protein